MKPVDQPRAGNFPEDDMTVQLAPPIERFLGELAASELSHVVDQFRTGFSALEMESFSNWHEARSRRRGCGRINRHRQRWHVLGQPDDGADLGDLRPGGAAMSADAIEVFIGRLRDRPWIEPALVDVIAHGLRTAACDPDPALWEQLREVIGDDDMTMADQLTQILEITAARCSAKLHAH
jgi:hypothetical protein